MDIDFQEKMAAKNTEDLLLVIENRKKYVPDAINAAVAELKLRGHIFSDQELEYINSDVVQKIRIENNDNGTSFEYDDELSIFPREQKQVYYSKQAIMGFSVFFSSLFGAILMAINLRKNKSHVSLMIAFGVIYTVLIYYIQEQLLPGRSSFSIPLNAIGGLILTRLFWPKFIGNNTQYIKREIWVPLVIAIIVLVVFIYFVYNFRIGIN